MKLCASVLAADHAYLARDLLEAERCGIDFFHFDVSDGHYAPYLLFGSQLISDLRRVSRSYFDVHLAVYNMGIILETFLSVGADRINLQFESADSPLEMMIESIRRSGSDACLTFTLQSSFEVIEPWLEAADAVNLLAVNPGIGGQSFRTEVLGKIEQCAEFISRKGLDTVLSVDGGINAQTVKPVQNAGAHVAIVGSGIFCGSIEQNIRELEQVIS
jgi:ribulose-phosphate 3-epimerase